MTPKAQWVAPTSSKNTIRDLCLQKCSYRSCYSQISITPTSKPSCYRTHLSYIFSFSQFINTGCGVSMCETFHKQRYVGELKSWQKKLVGLLYQNIFSKLLTHIPSNRKASQFSFLHLHLPGRAHHFSLSRGILAICQRSPSPLCHVFSVRLSITTKDLSTERTHTETGNKTNKEKETVHAYTQNKYNTSRLDYKWWFSTRGGS